MNRNLRIFSILAFFLVFLLNGCESDDLHLHDYDEGVTSSYRPEVNYVNVSDDATLSTFFASNRSGMFQSYNRSSNQTMIQTPAGQIPLTQVMQVIDTTGVINYTFRVIPQQYDPLQFDNLVNYELHPHYP